MSESRRYPAREPVIDPRTGMVNQRWAIYFRDLGDAVDNSPQQVIAPLELTAQSASIGTTALPLPTLNEGYYRLTVITRIEVAAGVSSSVAVDLGFTSGGVACSYLGTALTANATNRPFAETWMAYVDAATPITYTVTYASNPAAAAQYALSILIEQVAI